MEPIHYLVLSSSVFSIGFLGIFINRKNIITILMSIELMLLSANIKFVGFSYTLDDLSGQIFSLFILLVAAAEAAIGLAILMIFFKKSGSISIDNISKLKG